MKQVLVRVQRGLNLAEMRGYGVTHEPARFLLALIELRALVVFDHDPVLDGRRRKLRGPSHNGRGVLRSVRDHMHRATALVLGGYPLELQPCGGPQANCGRCVIHL
jgi:hypothetical protein